MKIRTVHKKLVVTVAIQNVWNFIVNVFEEDKHVLIVIVLDAKITIIAESDPIKSDN